MPNTQDTLAIIKKRLIDNGDITDLVEDRVYTAHFYDLDNSSIEFPMIILDYQTGVSGYARSHQIFNVHIYVYSKINSDQCLSIYQLIYETLQGVALVNENISDRGYMREEKRPESGYNDQVMSYYAISTWKVVSAG